MASWCCRENTGMGPSLIDEIDEKLVDITKYYPGTNYACLLDSNGRLISGSAKADDELLSPNPDRFCGAVSQLQTAAVKFAQSLDKVGGCTILHIFGDQNMFSCYVVLDKSQQSPSPSWILAFYTEIALFEETSDSDLDTTVADEGVAKIVLELESMLTGFIGPSSSHHRTNVMRML
eukprot:CAMPEP_0171453818 /NCGR_PEP_ID=MMETSP0945-20130129/1369_1 /TAXON_ID=109269 /ORGANISM="Vaucheria litorea, Strain CCMP2940" /LENGTH=176 /DNA_ID=CAMNT_0011978751 /DNA_START=31 /DNA_END=561 /DNA_ORIENTATION=+